MTGVVGNHDLANNLGLTVADTVKIKLRTELLNLSPDLIYPDPNQPRQEFDEEALRRLANSLRDHGQLQPILIRKDEKGRNIIVAGERRWRAAKLAGIRSIQALHCKQGDVLSLQLVENLLREELKPVEQARAYSAIMKRERWSARELARQLNIEHSGVAKALRLLKTPKDLQEAVDAGKVPHTTAYEISKQPEEKQVPLARAAIAGTLRGEDLRRSATARTTPAPAPAPKPEPPRPVLTLGGANAATVFTYSFGKIRVDVTGHRDNESLIEALEQALNHVYDGKAGLAGGTGRVKK